jgi:hypothetical protein
MENLNDDWIVNFENTDNLYKDFYKDDMFYTNIHFIYINTNNEIEKMKNETFLLSTPNHIKYEEILRILKKNNTNNDESKKYSLLSILKYNISLDTEEIIPFLKCELQDLEYYNKKFLTSLKNIDKIYFQKTISMFHDLNDLFFLFYEKDSQKQSRNQSHNQSHNQTQNTNTNTNNSHNSTKKVYFKSPFSSHKKTIRK